MTAAIVVYTLLVNYYCYRLVVIVVGEWAEFGDSLGL